MHLKDLTVTQRLGFGPHSNVFLATDRTHHRVVAIKVISIDHPEAKQELVVAQRLCDAETVHPNVLTYDAAFVRDDSLVLVMDALGGGDLHAMLESRESPRLPERDALRLWRQIVDGVAFLHDRDIAHRDLSLENILLDDTNTPKICDYGLSTLVASGQPSTGRVGKLYYMAPEVVADAPYDAKRADVWSLGMLLFVLLTGSPLVETASPSDASFRALAKVGVVGILRHWRMDAELSEESITLLERLLRIAPSERPPDARAILAGLQAEPSVGSNVCAIV